MKKRKQKETEEEGQWREKRRNATCSAFLVSGTSGERGRPTKGQMERDGHFRLTLNIRGT